VFGRGRTVTAIASLTLLAALAVAGRHSLPWASGASFPANCDRFAAPWGSDRDSGSRSNPYRTPQKLARSLYFGQTGCLRGGTYRFSELAITKPRITLRPYASRPVKLEGGIKVKPSGHHSTIRGLKLDGNGEIGPRIYANGAVLHGNEITNGHTSICVMVTGWYSDPAPRAVVIRRNRIHDCGELPSTNKDHGIYLAEARGTIVRDNWIYDNADRGIQLYHDADGSNVVGNVVFRNGDGMVINGEGPDASERNAIHGNIIAGSYRGYNVYSGDSGPAGEGNLLQDNCVWAGNAESPYDELGGVMTPARNYTALRNLVARPRFVDPRNDNFRLQADSRCLAKYEGRMSKPGGG
jgi:parallel beta-helix repeat protein